MAIIEPRQVQLLRAIPTASQAEREMLRRAPIAANLWSAVPAGVGQRGPVILASAGGHYQGDAFWEAGRCPEPPIPPDIAGNSNVLDNAGEYWHDDIVAISEHGAEHGHCWPYNSPGPQLEGQDPLDPGVGLGYYWPAAIRNQGINHYRRGFPFRRWMFGKRSGRFHILVAGNITTADVTNPTRAHCIEFAMVPNLFTAWNDGDGGTSTTPGMLPSLRSTGFRTPDFTFQQLSPDGVEIGTGIFFAEIWGVSVHRGISFWSVAMALCKDAFSDPIWATRRNFYWSQQAVAFDTTDGNMAFLFKVDGKSPTTQEIAYTGLSGTISAGDAVTKGGISGTVISHDADNAKILVGRINNQDFGTSGTLTGPTGSCTITASADSYQQFGKINNVGWTATPAAGEWPPNVPQDGNSATFQMDAFHVDFWPGM